MSYDWILDVLTDLRNFAEDNDLQVLAAHLQDTQMIAAIDIASQTEGMLFETPTTPIECERDLEGSREGKRAL